MTLNRLEESVLEELRQLDSCSVANAIETFGVRIRNTGFSDSSIHCMIEDAPPMVGYAATLRIRTSEPPMEGESYYYRLDWLDYFSSIPSPRILVLEDLDPRPGRGSFLGDVHENILLALGCVGVVTNGAIRNLETAKTLKLQVYARNLSVSHSFAHVLDFGGPVKIGQVDIQSGDVLHGDRHGVQTVPFEIAAKVPAVAQRLRDEEQEIIRLSQSDAFSVEKLRSMVDALRLKRKNLKG
jgi:regulator of RNase E activity RraA